MDQNPPTELSVLERAKSGDKQAWERVVDIYGPLIYAQCRRKNLGSEDAEEVTQDVFLAVSRGLATFRRDREGDSFLHWLRRIATRSIINWQRRNGSNPVAIGGSTARVNFAHLPDATGDEWRPDALKRQAIKRAIDLMKTDFETRTWLAFFRYEVEGRSTTEICDELDMKPGAVRNARFKVRKRLVEELGDLLDIGQPS